jgi:DNA-binding LacI/PurR family transcriptional regulator
MAVTLTTIHQPKSEIGQAAVNIIARLSKDKDQSPEIASSAWNWLRGHPSSTFIECPK